MRVLRWWFDKAGNGPASWPLWLVVGADVLGLALIVLAVRLVVSVW